MTARNRIEKLALNNQIVSMRKEVKRARLWLINNLNQRVKKLNERKGTEQEKVKNLLKSDRLRQEIQHLKDVDIDEVSKFALCNKQDSSSNISLLELEQQVMLKLANHEIVQKQVVKFRQSYTIPIDRLILLVRSLGLQYQKKKKKLLLAAENNVNSEKHSIIETKEKRQSEEKIVATQQNISSNSPKSIISTKRIPHVTSKKNIVDADSKLKKTSSSVMRHQHGDSPLVDEEMSSHSLESSSLAYGNEVTGNIVADDFCVSEISKKQLSTTKDGHKKITWPKLSTPQIDKKVGSMEIKQIHLDQYEAETIFLDSSSKIDNCNQSTNELPRDSFFLGGVDVPSENDDDGERSSALLNSISRIKPGKNFTDTRTSRNKTVRDVSSTAQRPPSTTYSHKQILPTVPVVEVLHPSWQAKRKEKELHISVSGCQGKKIKFDDN